MSTSSIGWPYTDLSRAATRIDSKKNDQNHRTLAGRMQESYFRCMQRMAVIFEKVSK